MSEWPQVRQELFLGFEFYCETKCTRKRKSRATKRTDILTVGLLGCTAIRVYVRNLVFWLGTFCCPGLPLSGTLGPAVKLENQQEFLLTVHASPARQTTAEEGEETSHVGNFGGIRPENIHEKGNQSFCTTNFRGACRTGNITFCTMIDSLWNLYHRVRI